MKSIRVQLRGKHARNLCTNSVECKSETSRRAFLIRDLCEISVPSWEPNRQLKDLVSICLDK